MRRYGSLVCRGVPVVRPEPRRRPGNAAIMCVRCAAGARHATARWRRDLVGLSGLQGGGAGGSGGSGRR